MAKFNEETIHALFEKSLKQAKKHLSNLPICSDFEIKFAGLNGWIFEQTVQHCIKKELKAHKLNPNVREQINLGGRTRADLMIDSVAIEIKAKGLFGFEDVERYRKYKQAAKKKGFDYIFVTKSESHRPYRIGIISALGRKNTFFLDQQGDWERLIKTLVSKVQPGNS